MVGAPRNFAPARLMESATAPRACRLGLARAPGAREELAHRDRGVAARGQHVEEAGHHGEKPLGGARKPRRVVEVHDRAVTEAARDVAELSGRGARAETLVLDRPEDRQQAEPARNFLGRPPSAP